MHNKNMKAKYILSGVLVAASTVFSSCSDFFDQDSDHVTFTDNMHLDSPADTIYSLTGIMAKMQALGDRTILLGEARGDLVDVTNAAGSDLRDIAQFNVGDDNIYTFGRSSDEVIKLYETSGYHAIEYYKENKGIKEIIDFITDPKLVKLGDRKMLKDLQDNLMNKDWFMTLLDLESYAEEKEKMLADYEDRERWKRMALVNIAKSGFFSSDRTIRDYNRDIWHLK